MKSNWQHQKQALGVDKAHRLDEHDTEHEKQKLHEKDDAGKQEAIRKHSKDSDQT